MSFPPKSNIEIRDVWSDNLEKEFHLIRGIVDDYPYIAMDTEFPGIVLRPIGTFKTSSDYHYQTLKDNVDMLKLIQLGLTFSDEDGNLPTCGTDKYCVWQFNFREFSVNEDVFANDSIELLRQSGIDFNKNSEKGIDAISFGELLMSSGIVLNDDVHWVTFHSGYDFGYLLKLLTCRNLPDTQAGFFNLIKMFFPTVYDIKHLMKFCNSLHGGLNKLAELLEVERIGICHQAGSDSLLTSCTFRKLKESFFSGSTEKYSGKFRFQLTLDSKDILVSVIVLMREWRDVINSSMSCSTRLRLRHFDLKVPFQLLHFLFLLQSHFFFRLLHLVVSDGLMDLLKCNTNFVPCQVRKRNSLKASMNGRGKYYDFMRVIYGDFHERRPRCAIFGWMDFQF